MRLSTLFSLSWRALTVNKLRSFLTTLGIIIGVFSIILLVSIGSGLQKYISDQIAGFGSNLIFVIPGTVGGARTPGGVVTNKLQFSDVTRLQQVLRARAQVAPAAQQSSSVQFGSSLTRATSILGTTANYPLTVQNASVESGIFFTTSQERSSAKVAVIGQTLVKNLFDGTDPIGARIEIGDVRYTVIGVLKLRGAIFGIDQDNVAIIPVGAARQQFGIQNPNAIYIAANSASDVSDIEAQAASVLKERLSQDDFTLQTSASSLSIVTNVTNALTLALGGISAVSLLVGGIGVANIMLVSVTERTREIGLRKALGAKRRDILTQFLLEAIILSVSGGVIGIILGLAVSEVIARFFVSSVTYWSVFLAFGFSVAVGVIFGMAPAIKASRLNPIVALRYE